MNTIFYSKTHKAPFSMAHRGYRTKCPENTLAAFDAAIDAGFPMIELDVTLSRDRKLVVIHDDTLDRTTDGTGQVCDYTLAELKKLDAGGWFHPDYIGERLPELCEVFDLVGGRAAVNVEIKSNAFEADHPADAVEHQVMDLVKTKGVLERVLVSSFNERTLTRLRGIAGTVALALISERPADDGTIEFCNRIDAVSWHPDRAILTKRQVVSMHKAGFRVFPYNVVTAEHAVHMLDMGVDGLIVDEPVILPEWK